MRTLLDVFHSADAPGSKTGVVLVDLDGSQIQPVSQKITSVGGNWYVWMAVVNDEFFGAAKVFDADTGEVYSVVPVRLIAKVVAADVTSALISVDSNYGGHESLAYRVKGKFVAGANILVYRAEDYNAGRRSNAEIVARSKTTGSGRWQHPIDLAPDTYVFVYELKNVAGPDAYEVKVF